MYNSIGDVCEKNNEIFMFDINCEYDEWLSY